MLPLLRPSLCFLLSLFTALFATSCLVVVDRLNWSRFLFRSAEFRCRWAALSAALTVFPIRLISRLFTLFIVFQQTIRLSLCRPFSWFSYKQVGELYTSVCMGSMYKSCRYLLMRTRFALDIYTLVAYFHRTIFSVAGSRHANLAVIEGSLFHVFLLLQSSAWFLVQDS